jgi:hypothetical protein
MRLPPPLLASSHISDLDMPRLLLDAVQQEHPEWESRNGESSTFRAYADKISVLFGLTQNSPRRVAASLPA